MFQVKENFSLQPYNTFGIAVNASFFAEVFSVEDIKKAIEFQRKKNLKILLLGGGSNILFTKDFEGLVVKVNLKGKEILGDPPSIPPSGRDRDLVKAMAGENWDDFVAWTVEQNLGGLENLSLIPGTVGACAVQNIGAYGSEIKDVFYELEALNLETLEIKIFSKEDCRFGYRDSVFKNLKKGKWVILSATFLLSKNPQMRLDYGAIQKILETKKIKNPQILDIRNAIVQIRESKLPDPKEIGSAGSFFKNPVVDDSKLEVLKKMYPEIPNYPVDDSTVNFKWLNLICRQVGRKSKIPAGWLIEQCGFKGKNFGNYGVYLHQALVLVNYGGASGIEILELAKKIQKTVHEKFGILLEMEVNIL